MCVKITPGCGTSVLCSHSRAQEYFTESIDPTMIYEGEYCENVIKFYFYQLLKQDCSNQYGRLGIYSQVGQRKPGRYFVRTNSEPPFARGMLTESVGSF